MILTLTALEMLFTGSKTTHFENIMLVMETMNNGT